VVLVKRGNREGQFAACGFTVAGCGAVRRLTLISIDLLLVASATVLAVMFRGYFDSVSASLVNLLPYILISVGCASVVFFVAGLERTPWRYTAVADYLQIIVLTVLAILLALVLTFALNRLEPVARSLPVLQGGLIVSILVCARGGTRFWHARQGHTNGNGRVDGQMHETILVVGLNTVSELFLVSVKEFAYPRVQVAGLVVEEPEMQGRAIRQTPILGTVVELQDILQSLEVHGVAVDRIVVATAADRLQPRSLESLLEIEKSSDIALQFLSEQLGLEDVSQKPSGLSGPDRNSVLRPRAVTRLGNVPDLDHSHSTRKSLLLGKRIIDVLGALLLIFTLAPVAVLVAFIVALDVGFPVIFWQQRPGLCGRPFKLYKFRTMRAPHDRYKNRIPDDQRSSAVGQLIRRVRLDELPQLYNVLLGDMSLIGPRPLLPRDQSPEYAARLSVRPGITGWAQVNGGRIIPPSDKCILDIWYAHNASLVLDLKIVLRTITLILFGDRHNHDAVNQARSDLGLKALLRTPMVPAE
jgi:lipopolysaccharide/colanic/teichoic acid biosynthesis glycosyltransferase